MLAAYSRGMWMTSVGGSCSEWPSSRRAAPVTVLCSEGKCTEAEYRLFGVACGYLDCGFYIDVE